MKDLSATEASRRFSEVLDAVEHRHESFVVVRNGRPIARITPASTPNGKSVAAFLNANRPDPRWEADLGALRAELVVEERPWNA
jgi:prevent-host-death family protein